MGGYRRRGVPRFAHVRITLYGNVTHAPRALTADRGEHDDRADALSQHRAGHPAPGLAHGNYHLSLWAVHQADRDATSDRHGRSEEHTSELQSLAYLVCRLLLEKKKKTE